MGDAFVVGLTSAAVGFALNRIVPDVYGKIKELLGDFCYKTTIITLSQSKQMLINMIKFLNEFKQFKFSKCVIIVIEKVRYEVPIGQVSFPVQNYNISMCCHTDNHSNITHISVSTWKRKGFSIDFNRLMIFNNFINKFPSDDSPFSAKEVAEPILIAMSIPVIIAQKSVNPSTNSFTPSPRKLTPEAETLRRQKLDNDMNDMALRKWTGPSRRSFAPLTNHCGRIDGLSLGRYRRPILYSNKYKNINLTQGSNESTVFDPTVVFNVSLTKEKKV
jgi:hypothetical protein